MNFTAKDVSDLRAQTGIGMMECKKALTEANGDKEEAVKILREKGLAVAEKKASRIAAEGVVDILAKDGSYAMVEVNSETDFVAKNDTFKAFVKGVLETILANKPADVDALLACKFAGSDDTVDAVLKDKTFQIGEKLSIRRFVIVNEPVCASYVHGGGTIGVIVYGDATTDKEAASAVLRNAALQVAAMNPLYPNRKAFRRLTSTQKKRSFLRRSRTMKRTPRSRKPFSKRWLSVRSASSIRKSACSNRNMSRLRVRNPSASISQQKLRSLAARSR